MFKPLLGLALILSTASLHSQDLPRYRQFVLGSGLSSVTTQVKEAVSDVTVVHQRPALIPDMIRALSDAYGLAVKPQSRAAQAFASRLDVESGPPISGWGTEEYSVVLFRSSFGEGFQVVVTSTALDTLARTADAQAVRLDQLEAPQRAVAQQKKDAEDARLSLEQTRATNNAAFRP